MIYKLEFERRALKEWKKLGAPVQEQFKKKLAERLLNPHIPSARLRGKHNRYKRKLKSAGYRLVYEVCDNRVILLVIAVGKRSGDEVYHLADHR